MGFQNLRHHRANILEHICLFLLTSVSRCLGCVININFHLLFVLSSYKTVKEWLCFVWRKAMVLIMVPRLNDNLCSDEILALDALFLSFTAFKR